MGAPTIYRLSIERYRSIKSLTFHPAKGVNLILGGGDVGKTTIVDAVSLLLSPTNTTTLSDTRRMAALAIAEQNQGDAPITVIDEIERGLEPYRQHVLLTKLEAGNCQAFVTTHGSFAVAAAGTPDRNQPRSRSASITRLRASNAIPSLLCLAMPPHSETREKEDAYSTPLSVAQSTV